jgi:hypothetical protein
MRRKKEMHGGPTAKRFFSPLIVTARGDDVLPTSLSFGFYPDQIPSLVEIKTDTAGQKKSRALIRT